MEKKSYWKLLYDEECPLCRKFAAQINKYDHLDQIEVTSLQGHSKQFASITLDELLSEVHLLGQRGEVLRGGEAVQKIISLIPQSKPFRWMIESRWGKKGIDVFYRSINTIRRCSRCNKAIMLSSKWTKNKKK